MTTWAPIVFWMLLIPLLIIMLITYLRSKQFSRLLYILAVFTYTMLIMYWIDAFSLGRNAIIGLLVLSSVLMMLMGHAIHKRLTIKKATSIRIAASSMILIAVLVLLSALPLGWDVQGQAVSSVQLSQILNVQTDTAYQPPTVPIYTVTVTSNFIPRQYELPRANACLYNSQLKAAQYLSVDWNVKQHTKEFGPGIKSLEVFNGQKAATLYAYPAQRWKERLRVPEGPPLAERPLITGQQQVEVYDQLLLFLDEDYPDCFNLQPEDFQEALLISITQN